MGVRPYLYFLCGVKRQGKIFGEQNDYNQYDEHIPYRDDLFLGKKEQYLWDIYYRGIVGGAGVAGYIIDRSNEDLARAFSLWFSENGENQLLVVPRSEPPDERTLNLYRESNGKEKTDLVVAMNHWYDTYTPWYIDLFMRRALFLLELDGVSGVERKDLELMILLKWE